MLRIVLFPIENFEREVPEKILPASVKDIPTLVDAINQEVGEEVVTIATSDTAILVYKLDDFVLACNDGEIAVDSYWLGTFNFND